ncbi:MAG: pyridoxamine 5'-phosphate oxidase [Candidatus Puniceispirillaceae bacterium]
MSAAGEDRDLPEMGVTPMVRHNGAFYIYPSHLSAHVRAMLKAGKAAFLVIEDEDKAQNIWARRRLKFDANIIEIDRNNDDFNSICDLFETTHGPTMGLIRDFSDFHLLRLQPTGGVMVLGFAKAYRLEGTQLAVTDHLRAS